MKINGSTQSLRPSALAATGGRRRLAVRAGAAATGGGREPYPEPVVRRWPAAGRLAFVLTTCGLFWGAVGFGLLHVLGR